MKKIITLLTIVFGMHSVAYAASIRAVNKSKGTVIIDEGSESGLKKGMSVCINDSKGKQIECGSISALKKKVATVKVSPAGAKKMKRGMEAIADGGGSSGGGTRSAKAPAKYRRNIKSMYIMTPMFPSTYQKLAYAPPPVTGTASTLWEPIGPPDISIMGFGAEAEFSVGSSMSAAVGFRMRLHRDFASEADFVQRELDTNGQKQRIPEYVETLESTSAMGFWADLYFYDMRFGKSTALRLGSGIDMDMSTVTLKATQLDDDQKATIGEFMTATSKLSVISLRLIPSLFYFLDPVGLSITPTFMVPIAAMGASFAGENTDSHATALGGVDPLEDTKAALGHQKNSFAMMVSFSAFFAF